MDEQILARLEKLEQQTKENHELLQKLYTFQKRKIIFTFVYWGLIILIALGALYFVRPMIEGVLGGYSSILNDVAPTSDLNRLRELQQQFEGQ